MGEPTIKKPTKSIAVIVAHPDDETLWCGGTILLHPQWNWFVACLCRRNDPDRAPKFKSVLKLLNAEGIMGDLDDGPDQNPLQENEVERAILSLLPRKDFDMVITHSPKGEYTRHLRHEEIGRAVMQLWQDKKINSRELRLFAFEDGKRAYYPKAIEEATMQQTLPNKIWREKYRIITEVYGFGKLGFEAQTTPKIEAFWRFRNSGETRKWLVQHDMQ